VDHLSGIKGMVVTMGRGGGCFDAPVCKGEWGGGGCWIAPVGVLG
jgi:hypothetical protein